MKRASAGLTPVRAGAALALLVAIGGLYGTVASDTFAARETLIEGATWTSLDSVRSALAVPAGTNVFMLRTSDLEQRLEDLPSIADAHVSVGLPDQVRVNLVERIALLGWRVGDRTFLVDATGTLFGELPPDAPEAAASLPVIRDLRATSGELSVGSTLDPPSLDAALRLGSLTAADIGSTSQSLGIRVDDTNGFVLTGEPAGWSAIFGFYTPTLRTTDLIPGQIRLLRSFMLDPRHAEDDVVRIILADGKSGTWVPRRTPAPSPSSKP